MRKSSYDTHFFFLLYTVLLVFLIISALSVSLYLAQSITTVTVSVFPSSVTACIGQGFSINVNISSVSDLYGWEFKLGWNSTLLDAVNVTEGNFLKNGGETFFAPKINNTAGYVLVDCTLLSNVSGVSGNGTLAVVNFYVEGRGESILDLFNTTLINSGEQEITHQSTDGYGYFTPAHDVAVIDITASPAIVVPGQSVQINATVENQGGYAESFNVTAYSNSEVIETQSVSLNPEEYTVLTFTWNTTEVDKGDYALSANASVVSGETDTADNTKVADSMVTVLSIGHDVAIKDVTPFKTVVGQGYSLLVDVTAKNYGSFTETFNVTVYYNDTAIILPDEKNYTTATLTSGSFTTITFAWNTTGFAKGNYTLSATATQLPYETDTTDNTLTDGWVLVTILGDANGDRFVNVLDYVLVKKAIPSYPGHPKWNPNADVNSDGFINVKDMVITKSNIGQSW